MSDVPYLEQCVNLTAIDVTTEGDTTFEKLIIMIHQVRLLSQLHSLSLRHTDDSYAPYPESFSATYLSHASHLRDLTLRVMRGSLLVDLPRSIQNLSIEFDRHFSQQEVLNSCECYLTLPSIQRLKLRLSSGLEFNFEFWEAFLRRCEQRGLIAVIYEQSNPGKLRERFQWLDVKIHNDWK